MAEHRPEDFRALDDDSRHTFVGVIRGEVAGGRYVFCGVKRRADFDLIDAPCRDDGPTENGHVLTKTVDDGRVTVVFQHWLTSLTSEATTRRRRQQHQDSKVEA